MSFTPMGRSYQTRTVKQTGRVWLCGYLDQGFGLADLPSQAGYLNLALGTLAL